MAAKLLPAISSFFVATSGALVAVRKGHFMTRWHAHFRIFASVPCFLLVLAAGGCSPARGTVTGKVTYKDKVVSWGTVSIFASDNMQYSGEIAADGTYAIANVPSGAVRFCVASPNPDFKKRGPMPGNDRGGIRRDPKQFRSPPANWVSLPERYSELQSTTLTGTVRSHTTIHLELN